MAGFVMRKDPRFKKLLPIRYGGADGVTEEVFASARRSYARSVGQPRKQIAPFKPA